MLVKSKDEIIFPVSVYEELVAKKLATKSTDTEKGLVTYKYAKKVMFENLWNAHPALMECRGITFDNEGNLIALPFRKSFNYKENGWWEDVPLNANVYMHKKYNGFMACVSRHNWQGLISTTGSTKSEFTNIARENLKEEESYGALNGSYLYEIVDQFDPHIVNEKVGSYYLGLRVHNDGSFHANGFDFLTTLEEAIQIAEKDRGEGFMLYLVNDDYQLSPCKLKTPYYVGKKRLMRMGSKEVQAMYKGQNPPRLGKDWAEIVPIIRSKVPVETWLEFNDQTRRAVLEHYWKIEKG